MVRRRTIVAAAPSIALAGCLGGSEDPADGGSGESGPRANVYFKRTYADDYGREPAVEIGVAKLGRADELRITSPDCDLEVALPASLDGTVLLSDDDELADCGGRPTFHVDGSADGVEGRIGSHTVSLSDTRPIRVTDGNAGDRLSTTGGIGRYDDGRLRVDLEPVEGATEVRIESPECPIKIPLPADEPLRTTLHRDEDLAACDADVPLWVVAADDDGEAIVFSTHPSVNP